MLGTIIAILAILAAAFAWSLCKVAGDGTREEERQEQIDRKTSND